MLEAIILAGGLGTRLRSVVSDLPKAMAEVAGKPFLLHVLNELQAQGVTRFVFSLGYKHELIEALLLQHLSAESYCIALEQEPLGTGGAIKLAVKQITSQHCIIVNADTLFKVDINALVKFHEEAEADCTLALKPMHDFDRYGVVEIAPDGSICNFKEKEFYTSGLINGGVYCLNKENFFKEDLPVKFSFEKDYLEKYFAARRMYGVVQDEYFIDIGIPEDYAKANVDLKTI